MPSARFSIGIDLGTTNCALAFVLLGSEARSEIFGIPQRDTSSTIMESRALPSFLYLADAVTATQIQPGTTSGEVWVVGRLARKKAAESPGRVVHSAKSWLCHHTSDRSARFLPWGSEDIARDSKISPVRASVPDASEGRVDKALRRARRLDEQIVRTTATSTSGLLAQLRLLSAFFDE